MNKNNCDRCNKLGTFCEKCAEIREEMDKLHSEYLARKMWNSDPTVRALLRGTPRVKNGEPK